MKGSKEKIKDQDPWLELQLYRQNGVEKGQLTECEMPPASFWAQLTDFQMQNVRKIQGPCDPFPRWVTDLPHLGKSL